MDDDEVAPPVETVVNVDLSSTAGRAAADCARALVTSHYEALEGDSGPFGAVLADEIRRMFGWVDGRPSPVEERAPAEELALLLTALASLPWHLNYVARGITRGLIEQQILDPLAAHELVDRIDDATNFKSLLPNVFGHPVA